MQPLSVCSLRRTGAPGLLWRMSKKGGLHTVTPCFWLGNVPGLLLPMLPTDLAAALRQELDGSNGLKVGWEAVADCTLLALLRRPTADRCRWDALVPHFTGRHTYMTTPRGQPPLGVA